MDIIFGTKNNNIRCTIVMESNLIGRKNIFYSITSDGVKNHRPRGDVARPEHERQREQSYAL